MELRPLIFAAGAVSAAVGCMLFGPAARRPAGVAPPPPAPAAPEWTGGGGVLLRDDFDGENAGRPTLMYDRFEHWVVEDGTVDLVGAGSDWDFLPGNGLYVDLDGDRPNGVDFEPGVLVSRETFVLEPGAYELSFRMGGSHRGDVNTTVVTLGEAYQERITLPDFAPFARYVRNLPVHERTEARLAFRNLGADGYGLLLDGVRLGRR